MGNTHQTPIKPVKILVCEKEPERVQFYNSLNDADNILEFVVANPEHPFTSVLVDEINPDIVIVGYDEIFNSSKVLCNSMLEKLREIKFVVSLKENEVRRTFRILKCGIKGVVLHDEQEEVLCECLFHLIKHDACISPKLVSKITGYNDDLLLITRSLSYSQKRVITEMLEGKSDKMIADAMNLSYHTIKTHRKNIFKKFKINSLGEFFSLLR